MRPLAFFFIHIISFAVLANPQSVVTIPVTSIPLQLKLGELVQSSDEDIAAHLALGLFGVGEGSQIDPILAESFQWEKAGMTLRIQLRKTVFSNGDPITTKEVIENLERCVRKSELSLSVALQKIIGFENFKKGNRSHLEGLKIRGPYTFEIITKTKAPLLLDDLVYTNCHIIKPSAMGENDLLKGAIGSGPYTVAAHDSDSTILVKRNNCSIKCNGPDKIIFKRTDDFGNFEVLRHWASIIETSKSITPHPDFTSYEQSPLGTLQLILNHSRKPFDNIKMRRAIHMALDIPLLAKGMGWSESRLQAGLFPFGMEGFNPVIPPRDLVKSKRLLRMFGFSEQKHLKFEILIAKSATSNVEASFWLKVFEDSFVQAVPRVMPYSEIVKKRNSGDFDALRITKLPGSIEGHRLLASYLSYSKFNTPRAKLVQCDPFIQKAMQEPDTDKRRQLYRLSDDCLLSNELLIPLSSAQPNFVLLKNPWKLKRHNRYWLRPNIASDWMNENL